MQACVNRMLGANEAKQAPAIAGGFSLVMEESITANFQ
jgi:hypothetical protein